MATSQITVEVSRTVQINSYEPVTVRVTQTAKLDEDDNEAEVRDATYASVTKAVKRYIDNEAVKYGKDKK